MKIARTRQVAVGLALLGAIGAGIAVLVLLASSRPNGRAEAADDHPASASPQVAISDSDFAALAKLRDQVQSEPHKIDPNLNRRILRGQLDSIIQGPSLIRNGLSSPMVSSHSMSTGLPRQNGGPARSMLGSPSRHCT